MSLSIEEREIFNCAISVCTTGVLECMRAVPCTQIQLFVAARIWVAKDIATKAIGIGRAGGDFRFRTGSLIT